MGPIVLGIIIPNSHLKDYRKKKNDSQGLLTTLNRWKPIE